MAKKTPKVRLKRLFSNQKPFSGHIYVIFSRLLHPNIRSLNFIFFFFFVFAAPDFRHVLQGTPVLLSLAIQGCPLRGRYYAGSKLLLLNSYFFNTHLIFFHLENRLERLFIK